MNSTTDLSAEDNCSPQNSLQALDLSARIAAGCVELGCAGPACASDKKPALASIAKAILAMDVRAVQEALPGLDLSGPLAGPLHAMELWGIGCHTLRLDEVDVAESMLRLLVEGGADIGRCGCPVAKLHPEREVLRGGDSLRRVAENPSFFFDWLDGPVKRDAMAVAMARWAKDFGMGREQWLAGQPTHAQSLGNSFAYRPSLAMARCLFKAFGKSFEPGHWLFFAHSTSNVRFEMDLLVEALDDEKPAMDLESRERLAAVALAYALPSLLRAVAQLPGGLGPSIESRSLGLYANEYRAGSDSEAIALPWAALATRSSWRSPDPVVGSPLFHMLLAIPEVAREAMANPRPAAFASACALDLIQAQSLAPWMLETIPGEEPWPARLCEKTILGIFIELCEKAPFLASQILAAEPSRVGKAGRAVPSLADLASNGRRIQLAQAMARLEAWEMGKDMAPAAQAERRWL